MGIWNIHSSDSAHMGSTRMGFGRKVRSMTTPSGQTGGAEKAGMSGTDKALGTPVAFKQVTVKKISTSELEERAEKAMQTTQTDFMQRFIKAFDPEGTWLEQSIPSDRMDAFADNLERKLKAQDFKGAREEMRAFLNEVADVAGGMVMTIGRRTEGTMRKTMSESWGNLAFVDEPVPNGHKEALGKTVDTVPGGGRQTQASKQEKDGPEGEYTSVKVGGYKYVSGYKTEEGMTVMPKLDPTRLREGEKPTSANGVVDGVIDKVADVYSERLESMYGDKADSPGMQQAIDAVLAKVDSLFHDAYQNNYSEDAESLLRESVEMFSGALFGQMGLDHITDRISQARSDAYEELESGSGLFASDAERKQIFQDKYNEQTADLPELSRLFTDSAGSGVGLSDTLFEGLESMFMDELKNDLGGRQLGEVKTTYVEGRYYTNEELEMLKARGGSTMETTV